LWVGDAQLAHQAGRHSILGGYQFSWDYVEDNAPAYSRSTGASFSNSGLYLQDEWRASKRLSLIGGGRFDKSNQVDHWIASPRVGMKVGVTDDLVWRITLSTGFRAPAIFDEDMHIAQVGGEGFVMQNAAGLEPEKSVSFTTGIQSAGALRGRRYQIGLNGFYTSLRGAFTLVEDADPSLDFRRLLRVNGKGAHVAGLDSDGNIQLTRRLGLRAGFTLQRACWSEPEEQFGARRFFRTPNTYGFFGFDWSLPAKVELSATADYTGSMSVPHYAGYISEDRLETSPRFVTFNSVVSRTFALAGEATMRLYLNIQNIGDNYQRDLDKGPNRDSAYVYGPSEMRRAVVGLTFAF
jgi:outer membrane receptor for ferrienterochelin and colicins